MAIRAGIAGATGYTGQELCKWLNRHPDVSVTQLYSQSVAGESVFEHIPQIESLKDLTFKAFDPDAISDIDVLFLALPHGLSHTFMPKLMGKGFKIIDLSADFRLKDTNSFKQRYAQTHQSPDLLSQAVYGLPELYEAQLKNTSLAAIPGCYSTSVILGLHPLAEEGWLNDTVIIDAKSGVSGAGKKLATQFLFGEVNEHFSAYATGNHRHMAEIEQECGLEPGSFVFSPHLVPMTRGIMSSIYVQLPDSVTESQVKKAFESRYASSPFITLSDRIESPSTSWVKDTNICYISYQKIGEQWVIVSMIDNLVKGASGQAVQAMNVMFGLSQDRGL